MSREKTSPRDTIKRGGTSHTLLRVGDFAYGARLVSLHPSRIPGRWYTIGAAMSRPRATLLCAAGDCTDLLILRAELEAVAGTISESKLTTVERGSRPLSTRTSRVRIPSLW